MEKMQRVLPIYVSQSNNKIASTEIFEHSGLFLSPKLKLTTDIPVKEDVLDEGDQTYESRMQFKPEILNIHIFGFIFIDYF